MEVAITYWYRRGRWSQHDTDRLRTLVSERTPPSRDTVAGVLRPYIDAISHAYVLVDEDHYFSTLAQVHEQTGLDDMVALLSPTAHQLREYVVAGHGESPYVAFVGDRGWGRTHGQRLTVNLITAAPGFIDVATSGGTVRHPTSSARASGVRRSPPPHQEACPTCHLALPGTSTCDNCDNCDNCD